MFAPLKAVRNTISLISADDFTRKTAAAAVILMLVNLCLLLFFWRQLPPELPLLYSKPWGEEQLVPPPYLFLLPGSVFLIILFNFLLASSLTKERLILRILSLAAAVVSFLNLFVLIKILELAL